MVVALQLWGGSRELPFGRERSSSSGIDMGVTPLAGLALSSPHQHLSVCARWRWRLRVQQRERMAALNHAVRKYGAVTNGEAGLGTPRLAVQFSHGSFSYVLLEERRTSPLLQDCKPPPL